jgi:hypothetical protein
MIATIIVTITNMLGMIVRIGTSTATDPEAFSVASARLGPFVIERHLCTDPQLVWPATRGQTNADRHAQAG